MRRGVRRQVSLLLIVAGVLAAGCSASEADDTTTTEATTTTPVTAETTATTTEAATTTTAAATATTVGQDLGVFCDAYLAFGAAQDPESRVEPLNAIWAERGSNAPDELKEVVNTLMTADFGSEDVRAQHAVLRDFVLPLCEATYDEGVVGAEDDATAAEQFFAALVSGDKESARTVAAAQIVALFEPWEPYPDQGGVPELVLDDGQFYVTLTPAFSFRCEMSDGVVTGCFFG